MRKPRSQIVRPGLPVHIMHRGNNRRRLFSYPTDYAFFLRRMMFQYREHGVAVHAACLMSNHVHALVTPPTVEALSRSAKNFAQAYANYRNGRRNGSGKLFEERFRSEAIKNEAHLAATTLYIERNPVAAGIVSDPAAYAWSSFRLHVGIEPTKIARHNWSPSGWYLALGETDAARAREYRRAYDNYDESKLPAEHRQTIAEVESASAPYSRRLERPDRTRAGEPAPRWATGDGE